MQRSPSSKFVLEHLRPERIRRTGLAFLGAISALISLGIPAAAGLSVAGLVGQSVPGFAHEFSVEFTVIMLGLFLLLKLISTLALTLMDVRTYQVSLRRVQTAFHEHLLYLTQGAYQGFGRDRLFNATFIELDRLTRFVHSVTHRVVSATLIFFGALVIMARIAPILTVVLFIAGPLIYVLVRISHNRVQRLSHQYWKTYGQVREGVLADIEHHFLVKAFSQEENRSRVHQEGISKLNSLELKRRALMELLGSTTQIINFAGIAMVVYLGYTGVFGAQLEAAGLVTFILYGTSLTNPLREYASLFQEYQALSGAIERLDEVLVAPEERRDGLTVERMSGRIEVRNLNFSYRPDEPVLNNLNLSIEAGEKVAFVGANGVGKTTLLMLLAGFWKPDSGEIILDGHPLDSLSLRSIRQSMSVVPQHTELLDATILENLLYAKPNATMQDIRAAAQMALADEFIDGLERGYDTKIGAHGIQLSGGQRQRVALARAILHDSPIVILDEATSMFDPESEQRFLDRARTWFEGRTLILVTHRPLPLDLVDRTITFSNAPDPSD